MTDRRILAIEWSGLMVLPVQRMVSLAVRSRGRTEMGRSSSDTRPDLLNPGEAGAPPDQPGHVGIYLGDRMMIDAPHIGTVIREEPVNGFGNSSASPGSGLQQDAPSGIYACERQRPASRRGDDGARTYAAIGDGTRGLWRMLSVAHSGQH